MSLFGDLYVGTSGLKTSQEAINVVAHNVTNTDTEGYVRQQVSQKTREYNRIDMSFQGVAMKQSGLGVYIGEVRQVRDRFLDLSYREEIGRQGFYDASFGAIEEIEEIFGEMDGATFYEAMNDFWTSIEELVKDPGSEVCQSMFVQYAQSFAEAAGNVYSDLANYQNKLNNKVDDYVDRINEIGHEIYKLNNSVRGIEAGGVENANDLKDQRNKLLDELSEIVNISYSDDTFGNVLVKIEGHDFVRMDKVNEIGCDLDDKSGFYKVYWPDLAKSYLDSDGNKIYDPDSAPIFDFTVEISSATDTDIGALKGTVLARGDHKGNWTDLFNEESYNEVKDSVMMNVMAEFDGLVRNVVTAVNKVLKDSAIDATNSINPSSTYLRDSDGNPIQLFTRKAVTDTTIPETISVEDLSNGTYSLGPYDFDSKAYIMKDAYGNELEGRYTKMPDGSYIGDSSLWFSVENISVNQELLQYPTNLGFVKPDGSMDYEVAKKLEASFLDKDYILNPNLTNPIAITDYYSNLVAQISNSGNVYKSLKENQELTVNSVEGTRQGTMGVASDEELSNMIKFQNAYNASSRFINVIDECLEHLITTLGS